MTSTADAAATSDAARGAAVDGRAAHLEQRTVESIALTLLESTQAAAVACLDWVGRGDKKAADGAAVRAMRSVLAEMDANGVVVIGEGEKDQAPMLHVGERLGRGTRPQVEIAVDPLEGTNYCASGREGAIAIVACAPTDCLWAAPAFYMDKMVVGPSAAGAVSIEAPLEDNLRALAEALRRSVRDLAVVILDKPRHAQLIEAVRGLGAAVIAIADGDIAGALRAILEDGDADLLLGVGGAPEGVITACAVRVLGGDMQARLAPQSDAEATRLRDAGHHLGAVLSLGDLVRTGDCAVAATGITGGILARPRRTLRGWETESLLVTPGHRGLRVRAAHDLMLAGRPLRR